MIRRGANLFRRSIGHWVDFARRGAWAIIAAAILSTAAGLYYAAAHLAISTDTTDLLSKKLPFRHDFDALKKAFPQLHDNIVIVIDGDNADVVANASAEIAVKLRKQPDLFPYVFDPADDPFFTRNGFLYLDIDTLGNLSDRLARAQPLLASLANDPTLRGFFGVLGLASDGIVSGDADPAMMEAIFAKLQQAVSARLDGRPYLLSWHDMMSGASSEQDLRHVIVVQPALDFSTLQPAHEPLNAIRRIAAQLSPIDGAQIRVRLTGEAALQDEELASVSRGASLAGVLSLVLVTALLVAGLRSARLVAASLVTLVIGLVWAATFAAVAIGHLNLISVTFAVLFIGVGVDFGIQFCLRYAERIAKGEGIDQALPNAAIGVGGALTLAAAAAAIGFFSFVPTAYIGLSELGIIAGVSMFIAWFANLTVLPALLAVMPLKNGPANRTRLGNGGAPTLGFVLRNPYRITVAALALGLGAATLVPRVHFDFDPLDLNDPTTESVQTFHDLLRWDPSAAYTIAVVRPTLKEADELAERLEQLPEVADALTVSDFVPTHQDEKLPLVDSMALFLGPALRSQHAPPAYDSEARITAAHELRNKLAVLAQSPHAGSLAGPTRQLAGDLGKLIQTQGASGLIELESSLLAGFPARLDQLRQALHPEKVTVADLPPDLRARAIAADGRALITVVPKGDMSDNAALRRFVAAVQKLAPDATDNPVVILAAGDAVVQSFEEAGIYSAIGIILLLLVVMRNAVDTVFVLVPLGLAAVFTIALMVLCRLPFNFANIIALPLLLCLGVGYGIYFVLRHRAVADMATVLATNTPRAVLFSALTTMCSFGTLAISHHRGTQSMGILLFLSLSLALVCTLIVLPAMQQLRERRAKRMPGPRDS